VRLRLVVPRRGRRAGLGGLAALALLAAVGGCGGGDKGSDTAPATTAAPAPAQTQTTPAAPATPKRPQAETIGDGLAIGLAENNANLLWAKGQGPQDPQFEAWRERITALRPHIYRITIDWANIQPDPSQPANLAQRSDGCARGASPCAPYDGIRDQLRAIKSQQDDGGGFQGMVVFYGVPPWAAAQPKGCERPNIEPRSRPINDRGLLGYRRLIRQVAGLAKEIGVEIKWWSVWNEPNGAFFISPQHSACAPGSPIVSANVYARLARALDDELHRMPGDQHLVIGELAGVAEAGRYGTGSGDFVRALPDDVVCRAEVVSQHAYATVPGQETRPGDPVKETEQALHARPCANKIPLWITETGIGGPHAGDDRPTGPEALKEQCRALHSQLKRWYEDPRIQAAFQYTFREDSTFPVGLADAGLTRAYPTYDLLKAWAGDRAPDGPAPKLPDACKG
jgi:hypothetical protein